MPRCHHALQKISLKKGYSKDIKFNQPQVVFSGGGSADPESYLEFAKGMGADRDFSKPMLLELLRNEIRKLLQGSELKLEYRSNRFSIIICI